MPPNAIEEGTREIWGDVMADLNDRDRTRRRKRRGRGKVYFQCLSFIIAQSRLHVKDRESESDC